MSIKDKHIQSTKPQKKRIQSIYFEPISFLSIFTRSKAQKIAAYGGRPAEGEYSDICGKCMDTKSQTLSTLFFTFLSLDKFQIWTFQPI